MTDRQKLGYSILMKYFGFIVVNQTVTAAPYLPVFCSKQFHGNTNISSCWWKSISIKINLLENSVSEIHGMEYLFYLVHRH